MTFIWPTLLGALVLVPVLIGAYVWAQAARDRRATAIGASGLVLTAGGRRHTGWRRDVPFAVLIAAVAVMIFALARPQATLATSKPTGTVLLLVDVSNSMGADDVAPTRLAVAQDVARRFVAAQPSSIDIGLVAFGAGALVTQQPTAEHAEVLAAIDRLKTGGRTSLGQGLLVAMSTIAGTPVALPDPDQPAPPSPGYFPSASILLVSDGEETGGPDPTAVVQLAADAGVHVSAIGIGTADGTTITVDGYEVATALQEQGLRDLVAVSGGTYAPADEATGVDSMTDALERRVTSVDETTEITAVFALAAIALLIAGGGLMLRWFGRVV
jgi:Ca-activated chloride channel family protein